MKIAIVLNTSWNVYNFRMGIIRALQREGHNVYVLAPRDTYSQSIADEGCEFHDVTMDSRGANPIKDMALIFEFLKLYRNIRPDIILHYTIKPNIYGTIAASLLRIPVINNVCGLGTVFLKKNLVSRIAELMYRISFRYPRKVFFQNDADLQLFLKRNLVKSKITDLVPGSGIDLDRFIPMPFTRNRKFTFLMISRIIIDKGIHEYVTAARILKSQGYDVRFQLLGATDEKHKRGIPVSLLNNWVEEQTIEYLGTTDDVRQRIEQADCIVLPSYREGTPRTLLEAAGSAKPIVATNVPGCNHVVEHNYNGLLCMLKDAEDLAEKMRQMMQMPDEELKTMGDNGRKKIETQFSEEIVISKYLDTIDQFKSRSL